MWIIKQIQLAINSYSPFSILIFRSNNSSQDLPFPCNYFMFTSLNMHHTEGYYTCENVAPSQTRALRYTKKGEIFISETGFRPAILNINKRNNEKLHFKDKIPEIHYNTLTQKALLNKFYKYILI